MITGVGLPPRGAPVASRYTPDTEMLVESLWHSPVSMPNSRTARSTSVVSRLARSVSNSRSSARPTRSSLTAAACPAASPNRAGANRVAHSPSP